MENSIPQNQLTISPDGISHLVSIRKWTMFLSILGFVASGFMILFGLFFGVVGKTFGSSEIASVFPSIFLMILYAALGAIYFFPSLYLYRFSFNMKWAIESKMDMQLNEALKHLRSFFAFTGILTIVMLVLCAFAIVGGIIFAVLGSMGGAS
jgi:hypothetical protein